MRIVVKDSGFPHPDDPSRIVVPFQVKVRQPDGAEHARVVCVDTDAHTVEVVRLNPNGTIATIDEGGNLDVAHDVIDVRGLGWTLVLPGDGPDVRREI